MGGFLHTKSHSAVSIGFVRDWWTVPLPRAMHLATRYRAPKVSGKHAETHEAGPAAGTRALTVMAPGRHAAGSNFGASAPAAAALESHPTVPVALPAPLYSCPPTPLSAMPVVTFTLTTQPGGEPGERQPGAEPGGQSPKLRSAGTPVNAEQADRPRCWIETLGGRWAARRAPRYEGMTDPASLPLSPHASSPCSQALSQANLKNLLGETQFAWESQAKVSLGKGNALVQTRVKN